MEDEYRPPDRPPDVAPKVVSRMNHMNQSPVAYGTREGSERSFILGSAPTDYSTLLLPIALQSHQKFFRLTSPQEDSLSEVATKILRSYG